MPGPSAAIRKSAVPARSAPPADGVTRQRRDEGLAEQEEVEEERVEHAHEAAERPRARRAPSFLRSKPAAEDPRGAWT